MGFDAAGWDTLPGSARYNLDLNGRIREKANKMWLDEYFYEDDEMMENASDDEDDYGSDGDNDGYD